MSVKRILGAFVIAILTVLIACSVGRTPEVGTPVKWFYMDESSSLLVFRGTWRPTVKAGTSPFGGMNWAANTVSVTCDRRRAECDEVIAALYSPEELIPHKTLDVIQLRYLVLEWDGTIIRARSAAPVGDFELRIAIRDKTAERSFRETRARGSTTANPQIMRVWVLDGN